MNIFFSFSNLTLSLGLIVALQRVIETREESKGITVFNCICRLIEQHFSKLESFVKNNISDSVVELSNCILEAPASAEVGLRVIHNMGLNTQLLNGLIRANVISVILKIMNRHRESEALVTTGCLTLYLFLADETNLASVAYVA